MRKEKVCIDFSQTSVLKKPGVAVRLGEGAGETDILLFQSFWRKFQSLYVKGQSKFPIFVLY